MLVFGQDKAIEALTEAIKMARAGLGHEHKPVGSFLFAGPTGVGKTEVTVQLAKSLGIELLRFDMSEYGTSYRQPLNRCASGLRRFRSGRAADRCGY